MIPKAFLNSKGGFWASVRRPTALIAKTEGRCMYRIIFRVHETCAILDVSHTGLYIAIKQEPVKAEKDGFRSLGHQDKIKRFVTFLAGAHGIQD